MESPVCFRCRKTPSEIGEYVNNPDVLDGYFKDPDDCVRKDEGTYNPDYNTFCCTKCYVEIGQPSNTFGWKAPPVLD